MATPLNYRTVSIRIKNREPFVKKSGEHGEKQVFKHLQTTEPKMKISGQTSNLSTEPNPSIRAPDPRGSSKTQEVHMPVSSRRTLGFWCFLQVFVAISGFYRSPGQHRSTHIFLKATGLWIRIWYVLVQNQHHLALQNIQLAWAPSAKSEWHINLLKRRDTHRHTLCNESCLKKDRDESIQLDLLILCSLSAWIWCNFKQSTILEAAPAIIRTSSAPSPTCLDRSTRRTRSDLSGADGSSDVTQLLFQFRAAEGETWAPPKVLPTRRTAGVAGKFARWTVWKSIPQQSCAGLA